jgi:hypothetical protein
MFSHKYRENIAYFSGIKLCDQVQLSKGGVTNSLKYKFELQVVAS